MRKILFAVAAAASLAAAIPAYASDNTENRGGIDIGPMGQCFDARACGHGHGRGAYASVNECPMVRERVVTASGHVIFRRHRVCD
jgi:hypothetical protein